ncbi:hypothetical protein MKW94_017224 [Papaver nudicaule]|uniref:Cytochrome P450 n=1 Tax=Papaver nudicaule TaxID=74823 RepID=A0AA42AYJ6_PAPNU|nr:hypothetical protein [Papaver nudicaule]
MRKVTHKERHDIYELQCWCKEVNCCLVHTLKETPKSPIHEPFYSLKLPTHVHYCTVRTACFLHHQNLHNTTQTSIDCQHLLYSYRNQFSSPSKFIIGAVFAFLLYCVLALRFNYKKSRINKAPEVAGAWPIIGHLHHLVGGKLLHETLGAMADKYGPAFTIRMGPHKALVVSSWEKNQVAIKHMGYGAAMFGIAPYGPYYLEMRKMVSKELLSNTRLELLKHVWVSEINTSVKELYDKVEGGSGGSGPVLVEMKRWFGYLTLKTTVKVICGKQALQGDTSSNPNTVVEHDEVWRFQKALRDFFKLLGHFRVSDVIPLPEWLDFEGYEEMKTNGRELDRLMEKWLDEHKVKKKKVSQISGEAEKKGQSDEQDFMDLMMSKLEDDAKLLSYYDADTINKSTCLTLILGGSDTTSVSLTWALSLLVNHPDALKKAHDELDIHVGKERQVNDLDIKNLKYLQAIIKETLRLYPPGVLTAPRVSKADCRVAGYDIPAGTRLFVNIWKIHRDPRVWIDPSEFQPERFLTGRHADVEVRGQNFELIPFGSGRRSCPGTSFALQVLHLALARLLQGFDFKRPSDEPIDMTECQGLTNAKATLAEVLVTPRLPSKLYTC